MKCPTCPRRFLTRRSRDTHTWQCPFRHAAAADWLHDLATEIERTNRD